MTLHLGKTSLRVHPLLPILWAFFGAAGMGTALFQAILALLLHEAGHLLMAALLRVPVESIEITPLGGIISLHGMESLPRLRRVLIAAAGPAASLGGCLLASVIYQYTLVSFTTAGALAKANLTLAVINLLPLLPLDGGQILRAILCAFFPYNRVTKALSILSSCTGALLCCLTVWAAVQGRLLLSPVFVGCYLMYAAATESKSGAARYITALIARRQKIERQEMLPVQAVAVSADMTAGDLLQRLNPGKYHVIRVLSPDGLDTKGILDERQFCEGVLNRPGQTLGELLTKTAAGPNA